MDNQLHIDRLINDYLKGRLSGKALADFEILLEKDQELYDQVQLEKEMHLLFLDADTLDLKAQMQADLNTNELPQNSAKTKIWWTGIGLVTFFGVGVFLANVYHDHFLVSEYDQNVEVAYAEVVENEAEVVETEKQDTIEVEDINPIQKQEKQNIEKVITSVKNGSVSNITKSTDKEIDEISVSTDEIVIAPVVEKIIDQPKTIIDSCENVTFKGKIILEKALVGESNGSITVDQLSVIGGKAPYMFSLNREIFQAQKEFSNLDGGKKYGVFVKDANACIKLMNDEVIHLNETQCLKESSFTFNPYFEEEWVLPSQGDVSYSIVLQNRVGEVFLKKEIQSGDDFRWNGEFDDGIKPTLGRYNWYVTYNNGETCLYKMTIIQ